MKLLRWVVLLVVASQLMGCVYATYNATQGNEELRVISLFKEVDGFSADRIGEEFAIEIDKTRGNDPFEGLADLIQSWQQLQEMGIQYEPPEATN